MNIREAQRNQAFSILNFQLAGLFLRSSFMNKISWISYGREETRETLSLSICWFW